MAYRESVFEALSKNLAPVFHKLTDVSIKLMGIPVQLLRISATPDDVNSDGWDDLLGDETYSYQSQIVNNVYVNFPFNEVDTLVNKDSVTVDSSAFYMEDLLPIEVRIPFEGDKNVESVHLDTNDLLVIVMFDSYDNKLPIILQAPRLVTSYFGRYEVGRKYEVTLFRGTLEPEIQGHIDDYIESLGIPTISSVYPASGDLSVSVDTDIVINFGSSMYEDSVEDNFSLFPEVVFESYEWNSSGTLVTISPSGNLTSGTTYIATLTSDTESAGRINLEEDYIWNFTT